MHRFRFPAVALLIVALAACSSDSTAPQGPYGTFDVAPDATGPYPAPAPTVQPTSDGISINGWIDTPTPCYTVTGSAVVSHDTLVAHVVARKDTKDNVGCEAAIQPWKYAMTASGIPSTVTAIRVAHNSEDGTEVTVLQQAFTQP